MRHDIEVVVDRLVAGKAKRARVAEAVDMALRMGEGELIIARDEGEEAPKAKKTRGNSGSVEGAFRPGFASVFSEQRLTFDI